MTCAPLLFLVGVVMWLVGAVTGFVAADHRHCRSVQDHYSKHQRVPASESNDG